MAAETGVINVRDIRPYFMRLFPSVRRRLAALPAKRNCLQKDLRNLVKELGPSLGEIYYKKDVNWKDFQLKKRQHNTVEKSEEPAHGFHSSTLLDKKDR